MVFTRERILFLSVIACLLLTGSSVFCEGPAANLIKNGDFSDEDTGEFAVSGRRGHFDFSIHTEEYTWNRCARLEILNLLETDDGTTVNTGIGIGGARGWDLEQSGNSFYVDPGAVYEFSFELRGTVSSVSISAFTWPEDGEGYYGGRNRVSTSLGRVSVQEEWKRYEGTFTVDENAWKGALYIRVWCDGSFGIKPGDYLKLDNIFIRRGRDAFRPGSEYEPEKAVFHGEPERGVAAVFTERDPVFDGTLEDPLWRKSDEISGFSKISGNVPADIDTRAAVLAAPEALWVGVRAVEPAAAGIEVTHKEDGAYPSLDDCLEIFFHTGDDDVFLQQLVINPGGFRFMGRGVGAGPQSPEDYGLWEARVSRGDGEWTAVARISYCLLGWGKRPESGAVTGFNIARVRRVGEREFSSWSPVFGSFHNRDKFGTLVFGRYGDDLLKRLEDMRGVLEGISGDLSGTALEARAGLLEKLDARKRKVESASEDITRSEWKSARSELKAAGIEAGRLQLAGARFVITGVRTTDDFTIPYNPPLLSAETGPFDLYAAVNDYKILPLAITNMTERTETYRVLIFSRETAAGIESFGLEGEGGGPFPPDNIALREAVRVKDSDAPGARLRLDPLPLMNQAFTLMVPPYESGLVWAVFKTAGVAPGKYQGAIRVIPLSEPARFEVVEYVGEARDVPLTLTVWPFELPEEPAVPLWLMTDAPNEDFFRDMREYGNQVYQLNAWAFLNPLTFGEDGSLETSILPPEARDRLSLYFHSKPVWMEKYGIHARPRYLIGFSAYTVFYQLHAAGRFEPGTPEWERAWSSWVRELDRYLAAQGFEYDDYVVELWDEPKSELADLVYEVYRIAKEAVPGMQLAIIFCGGSPQWTAEQWEPLIPYVDVWCPWESYFAPHRTDYLDFLEKRKGDGDSVWFYQCYTSLRLNAYNYYRLHPWKGYQRGTDVAGMYIYTYGPHGAFGASSWKTTLRGGMSYRSYDEPVPSIRLECLRQGSMDVKYLVKLENMVSEAPRRGALQGKLEEIEGFLSRAAEDVVITNRHTHGRADEVRNEAAAYILELKEALERGGRR